MHKIKMKQCGQRMKNAAAWTGHPENLLHQADMRKTHEKRRTDQCEERREGKCYMLSNFGTKAELLPYPSWADINSQWRLPGASPHTATAIGYVAGF